MAMYRCGGGSGGGVTPTPITPSNSSPAAMTSGTAYEPTANGYAISSYSDIFPNDVNPARIIYDNIYKATNDGYAVGSQPINLLPSNSSPASIQRHSVYIAGDHGYAIENYDPATPSDSDPAGLTSGNFYKMNGGGYAIASQPTSKTPDDTTPPSVSVGDIVKITTNSGYLYKTQQGVSGYSVAQDDTSTEATSFTLSNMSGKKLLVLLFTWKSSSNLSYNAFDGATASGGTISKITNLLSVSARTAGTFYYLDVTSNTCTVSIGTRCYLKAFETV